MDIRVSGTDERGVALLSEWLRKVLPSLPWEYGCRHPFVVDGNDPRPLEREEGAAIIKEVAPRTEGPWEIVEPATGFLRIVGGFDVDADDDGRPRDLSEIVCEVHDNPHEGANAASIAAVPAMEVALEAVLTFHRAPHWDAEERRRWLALTGSEEATTKSLCDLVRKALVR